MVGLEDIPELPETMKVKRVEVSYRVSPEFVITRMWYMTRDSTKLLPQGKIVLFNGIENTEYHKAIELYTLTKTTSKGSRFSQTNSTTRTWVC